MGTIRVDSVDDDLTVRVAAKQVDASAEQGLIRTAIELSPFQTCCASLEDGDELADSPNHSE